MRRRSLPSALQRQARDPVAQLRERYARRLSSLRNEAVRCHPREVVRFQAPNPSVFRDEEIDPRKVIEAEHTVGLER